jgi:hypothetical protein
VHSLIADWSKLPPTTIVSTYEQRKTSMSKGYSLGTGALCCFGNENGEEGFQAVNFPKSMGPVNIVKVCNGSLILLEKGLTCRYGENKDCSDESFEVLGNLGLVRMSVSLCLCLSSFSILKYLLWNSW